MLEDKNRKINTIRREIDSGSYKSRYSVDSVKYSSNHIDYLVDTALAHHKIDSYVEYKSKRHRKQIHTAARKKRPIKEMLTIGLALMIILAAIPYILPPLYGDFGTDISISLNPENAFNNDTMYVNMTIPTNYNITSVTADMAGIETLNLTLIDNTTLEQFWQTVWVVHNTEPGEHIVMITALDNMNTTYSAGVRWSIPPPEEIPDDNQTTDPTNKTDEPSQNETQNITTPPTNITTENETINITTPQENMTQNDTTPPTNITKGNETIIPENISVVSIADPREENVYAVPGTNFYVERTVEGFNGTNIVFVPLYSDDLTIKKIEILHNKDEGDQRLESNSPHIYPAGKGSSEKEKKIDNLREELSAPIKALNQVSYSNSFELEGPVTIRIWFAAPSYEDIRNGVKSGSGRISYLVYSEDSDDFDFESSTWWNSAWDYRKLITINSSQVDADLTNFPILVNITDSDLSSRAQDDGDDIAFVLWSDNTTQLNHEIELFNGSTGELIAWVNVTSLSSSIDTKIWMYYNNSAASDQQNPTGVWDSNYLMVQHMNDSTTSTILDSTSNNHDGTKGSANNPIETTGKIGKGQDFSSDQISCGDLRPITAYTAECWIKTDSLSGAGDQNTYGFTIMASATSGQGYPLWLTVGKGGSSEVTLRAFTSDVTGSNTVGANLNTVDKFYITATATISSTSKVYVNGVEKLSFTADNTAFTDIFTIGDLRQGRSICFDGMIDEVRISNIVRNDSWINTSYNTMNSSSTFLSVGGEEQPVPIVSNPVPSDGATGVSVPPDSFNITISDLNGDNMNITWRTNESGTWETFNTTDGGGTGVGDGTYNTTNTTWVTSYLTKYWWSVNVTDGTGWTNHTYSFTTRPDNYEPVISNVYPANGSTGIDLQVTCHIEVTDNDLDTMTVYWYNSTDGITYYHQQTNNTISTGDTVYWTYTQANTYSTDYWWKIAANDTKTNVTRWYNFTTRSGDTIKPNSNVTAITKYWYNTDDNPQTLTCTDAQDDPAGDGIKNVTLYYYNSTDNSSWTGPWNFGTDEDPWISCSWSFTFPNSTGWYRFHSRAADNASPSNIEDPPAVNDTECGYDVTPPTSSIDPIAPYNVASSPLTIDATASDSHSGVKNVTLWYRNSIDNASWGNDSNWWNNSWNHYRIITIDHNKVETDLANFPALVVINSTIGSQCDGGNSIRFLNTDNSTEYYYEIEEWNSLGNSYIWVNITHVSSTVDTTFLMYYNNSGASDNQNPSNVWDSNYLMVQHMNDSTTSTILDSTSNNHDGTKGSANNPIETTGKIGKGQDFSSDQISCGDLRPITAYTAECWIKTDSLSGAGDQNTFGFTIMASATSGQGYPLWLTVGKGGNPEVTFRAFTSSVTGSNTVNANLNTVDNFYITATATISSTAKVFVNSVEKLSFTADSTAFTDIFTIGDLRSARAIYFDGMIDEIRISNIVRNDSWINTSHNTMNSSDTFLSVGSEQNNSGWLKWDNVSNPDTAAPWSWDFDFPGNSGYYEFYSIANDTMSNQEDAPLSADARCRYSTEIDIIPSQWDVGATTIGSNNYSTSDFYFNLTNNGTATLNIQINASNATNSTTGARWNLTLTPGHNDYSLQYNKSGGGTWTNINLTYDTFVTNLGVGSWQTFDLNLFMATTSSKSDPMSIDVTFKSVAS